MKFETVEIRFKLIRALMGFCTNGVRVPCKIKTAGWYLKVFSFDRRVVYVSKSIGACPRECAGAPGVSLKVQRYAAELRAMHEFSAARTRVHISHRLEPEPGTFCPGSKSCRRPLSDR